MNIFTAVKYCCILHAWACIRNVKEYLGVSSELYRADLISIMSILECIDTQTRYTIPDLNMAVSRTCGIQVSIGTKFYLKIN